MRNVFIGVLLVLVVLPLAYAECDFLSVATLSNASVAKGVRATFPIALTNLGSSDLFVRLSGSCENGLDCYFEPTPAYVTLVPAQSAKFDLLVGTSDAEAGSYSIPLDIAVGAVTTPCDSRELRLAVTEPGATPTPAAEFVVSMTPSGEKNFSARPGEEVEFVFSVQNNGGEKVFADFSEESFLSSAVSFEANSVDVAAGETREVTATLTVPPGTPGRVYEGLFRVEVTESDSTEHFFDFPYSLFIYASELRLFLLNEPVGCIEVTHDERTVLEMGLKNDGDVSGPFRLGIDASDFVKEFVSLDSTLSEIAPGDKQFFGLVIAPAKTVPVDTYYYNLVVNYLGFPVFNRQYCFNVNSVLGFFVAKEDEYTVTRCEVQSVSFTVTNNGSVKDSYAVEVPNPGTMLVQASPSSFTLSPGEEKKIDLVLSTSLEKTPLGAQRLKVIVRSQNTASQAVYLDLNAVPSQRRGESFLEIEEKNFEIAGGVPTRELVSVRNTGRLELHGVSLALEGIPEAWFSVSPSSKDLESGGSASFVIDFTIPSSVPPTDYDINLTASSEEGESVKTASVLAVGRARQGLDFRVFETQYYSKREGGYEIIAYVTVRNTGATALKNVQPVLSGYAVLAQPSFLNLAPGESQSMLVSVSVPKGAGQEMLALAVRAGDGTLSNLIDVPAAPEKPVETQGSAWFLYALLAVIIVVLGLVYIKKKEKGELD